MFIDTHTHLFSEQFDTDRNEIVQRAINAGVEKLFLPNIDLSTINSMNEMVANYPNNCYPMIGIHPCSVEMDYESQLIKIREELAKEKYIAVGEIGMDLYWSKDLIEEQKKAFSEQIKLAKEFKLPIVIHARDSFNEIFEIVDELNDDQLTGVFHCFTGTLEQAEKIINYGGFKLGLGGVLTFKKSGLDSVIQNVDSKHLILETDSPYLAPTPFRGKRNESSYILHIAEKLADVKGVSLLEIEQQTTENALDVFNLQLNK